MRDLRHDWTLPEIESIYTTTLPDLIVRAQSVHRSHHNAGEVQGCTLLSIKTGGCPEDCAYCPQSAHYQTNVSRTSLVPLDKLTAAATDARAQGATRFCMGAAWRDLMPASQVRLSAGRLELSDEAQALCFVAGANSIFLGDRLLTTPNPGATRDEQLLDRLGMRLTTMEA